jgi:intron-binding protein aquarius
MRAHARSDACVWTCDGLPTYQVIVAHHEQRLSQIDAINQLPLYPNELLLWDENVVPSVNYAGEGCLALPKLNLQFLTLHDYLLRNFNLFRLESTYEIREDVMDIIKRINPRLGDDGSCVFHGWARMASPVDSFKVIKVAKPNLGDTMPAQVLADFSMNLGKMADKIRFEWQDLKQHDIIFFLTLRPILRTNDRPDPKQPLPFNQQYGVAYVRGAEVFGMLNAEGNVVKEGETDPDKVPRGDRRTWRVWMDAAQYQIDMANMSGGGEDVYQSFNIVMRRKPKENNFKAVLECIRDLMNTECIMPEWLHDTFLGYGDPAAATYQNMEGAILDLDFYDTFLDAEHARSCFPGREVELLPADVSKQVRPFRVQFADTTDKGKVTVEAYVPPYPGPYPEDKPKLNAVRFTDVQVSAIRSGLNPGLTQVVGPPGTGKTDVAVQIISNLYHTFPNQRTLIVTHSNQALNDLFDKIAVLNIHERHLLRLGHGEEGLETEKDFSRFGRVNYMLGKRLQLLEEVGKLSQSLELNQDVNFSCESAANFNTFHVVSRWEVFLHKCAKESDAARVQRHFPFNKFFADAPGWPLFDGADAAEDMRTAEGCYTHIKNMFSFLEDCRPFELLRSSYDRGNYLLTRQARIIAMTCTHAALKRRDFVKLGFQYDNLLMEESAQILEIETFIPMLLQEQEGKARLKRVILIGDHNQLPPVVKNMAFQKYSHFDQSLFTRFVRLQVWPQCNGP